MNRHERRTNEARRRYTYKLKGKPGFKLLRRMFRAASTPNEAVLIMSGANRQEGKKHPGYPKMGNYTKVGFKLTTPKGSKKR